MGVKLNQPFALNTIGHESDVRVATLESFRQQAGDPVPGGATAPIEPPGIQTLAVATGDSQDPFDYFLDNGGNVRVNPNADRDAEMIYWEREGGGRVFNAGAIGNGIALYSDPVFAGLVRNVLRNFLG